MKGLMRVFVLSLAAIFTTSTMLADEEKELAEAAAGHKILVAYFSRVGNNYVSGEVVNLPVGNTAAVAQMIHEKTGADLFEIKTVKNYPEDYHETTEVAKAEKNSNARPELVGNVPNLAEYDVIILGYPNWWGTMPMAVYTFLEKHDLTGKMILPLCTHEGSGMGSTERDIRKMQPGAEVKKGLPIRGGKVYKKDESVGEDVEKWLIENL